MSHISSVPEIILKFLNGETYTSELDSLKNENRFVYFIIHKITSNVLFLNLVRNLTNDLQEQVVALLYLINLSINDISLIINEYGINLLNLNDTNHECIMNIFRTAIFTQRSNTLLPTIRFRKRPVTRRNKRHFVIDPEFVKEKINLLGFNCQDICAICHNELDNGVCMIYKCGHVFHGECINIFRNSTSNFICPNCRGEIINVIENVSLPVNKSKIT